MRTDAKKHFSMLFAIFILLQKNEQARRLSSLIVNMFLKSDLSFPEKGKSLPQISCPKSNVLIERWPVLCKFIEIAFSGSVIMGSFLRQDTSIQKLILLIPDTYSNPWGLAPRGKTKIRPNFPIVIYHTKIYIKVIIILLILLCVTSRPLNVSNQTRFGNIYLCLQTKTSTR